MLHRIGKTKLMQFTNVERNENVRFVVCFSASGGCMPSIMAFKWADSEKQMYDLSAGPAAYMSDSGNMKVDLSLKLLQHFQGDVSWKMLAHFSWS